MEKDEIIIRNAVMHVLNTNHSQLEFSDTLLELSPDINDFLRNHIFKIIASDESKECEFLENSETYRIIYGFLERDLLMVSQQLAYNLYEIMNQNIYIPPADLFVVTFQVNQMIHFALIKMNYKESFIHSIEKGKDGISNSVRKQKLTLPSITAKPTEAAVINLHDYTLRVVEKKYEVNGVKINYFTELFLFCKTQLSDKAKLNIVTKAIDRINLLYYKNNYSKTMEAKAILYQENLNKGLIEVNKLAEQLYDNDEVRKEFKERLEKYNFHKEEVKPKARTTVKKLEKQYLTTETGIEVNIPMERYLEGRDISFIDNPDGTVDITIKNIDSILVK